MADVKRIIMDIFAVSILSISEQ